MNRKLRGLLFTVPALVIGGFGATGCDKVADAAAEACGPCGSIVQGDVGISGDARLDGFFNAVGTLNAATGSIKADFDANIAALAALYDVDVSAGIDGVAVDKVIAAIKADVTANVDGGLQIRFKPAECHASIDVAVKAQANCEAKAQCDVKVDPGEVKVECTGKCEGSCEGTCEGTASCAVQAPSVTCEGSCEGTCEMSAGASCTGTCHGDCSGECSAKDANGKCSGTCSGTCSGSCELTASAKCDGKCTGKCLVEPGSASCDAKAECRGECKGQCGGSCTGTAKPPSASADCEASADCQASASAQGSASLECTPPELAVDFKFNASASGNVDAQAAFTARLAEVKARGAAIAQGATKLKLLIQGDAAAKIPSPVAQITGQIEGFASADAFAKFDVPAGRITCVVTAVGDAVSILADAGTKLTGTIAAQAKFVAYISTGT